MVLLSAFVSRAYVPSLLFTSESLSVIPGKKYLCHHIAGQIPSMLHHMEIQFYGQSDPIHGMILKRLLYALVPAHLLYTF